MSEEYRTIYWINPNPNDEILKITLSRYNLKNDKSWIMAPWRIYLKDIKKIWEKGPRVDPQVIINLEDGRRLEILNSSLEQTKGFFKPQKSVEERLRILEKRFDTYIKVNRKRE